jgi:hypothetical protein
MTEENFRASLSQLHSELKNVQHVDRTSGDILKKLGSDIQRILENSGEVPRHHHESLLESLKESIEHFEVSHPRLSALMSDIVNMFGDMGI